MQELFMQGGRKNYDRGWQKTVFQSIDIINCFAKKDNVMQLIVTQDCPLP